MSPDTGTLNSIEIFSCLTLFDAISQQLCIKTKQTKRFFNIVGVKSDTLSKGRKMKKCDRYYGYS